MHPLSGVHGESSRSVLTAQALADSDIETANSLQEATFAHNIDFVADAKAKLSADP